ncbi:hypothetical protein Desdi_0624 [Desulfitobacterium dichloroeliminans LMG P-21439]|uniref:Uncharacterized protein n=1 Tax=Desulfitobacterium dichloroeliminans (strain LMG P-21439 / DCA1) TaxID=871963 RepID=L0F2U2_DESDL|nr:hypothetical protein Desdi_0624 [Desulfitobacterium dichloroeliminans LMG P-21439]
MGNFLGKVKDYTASLGETPNDDKKSQCIL